MTESQAGSKAAALLQNALRSQAGRFSSRLKSDKKRIKDVEAKKRMRRYQRKDGSTQTYLRGIAVVMVLHGFVQHYGIQPKRVREGSERTRHKPKKTTYRFKSHLYKKGMAAQPFIDSALKNSGAVEFLSQELPKIRGEELLIYMKKHLES